MIGVTIYGNTNKHISVMHVLDQFFDVDSMVISVLDQSDHIWQYGQIYKCYICSGVDSWCKFNGDVCV